MRPGNLEQTNRNFTSPALSSLSGEKEGMVEHMIRTPEVSNIPEVVEEEHPVPRHRYVLEYLVKSCMSIILDLKKKIDDLFHFLLD